MSLTKSHLPMSLLEVNPSQMHLVFVAELFTHPFASTCMNGMELLGLFPHGRFKQNRKVGSEELEELFLKSCTKPLAMLVGGIYMLERSCV